MARFFHSQWPTFGSYKSPDAEKVEASPYYWWWYALTLNEDYALLCEPMENGTAAQPRGPSARQMRAVYNDFGDVRYEGNRYVAFCQWWRAKVHTGEERGVYLFAEPPHTASVRHITDADAATAVLEEEDTILVAINFTRQIKHIDGKLERILRKHMGDVKKGRQVRDPKFSQARYSLSKTILIPTLQKTFSVYAARATAEAEGRKISNEAVAEQVQLEYHEREKDEAALTPAQRRRVISAIVSRHMKDAKTMIANAGLGVFPK